MRSAWLLALGLLATVDAVGAQSPELLSRIDAQTAARVVPVLEVAAVDSLPMGALESKVLEGVAKRVPPARIGQAVSDLADELRSVRQELRTRRPATVFSDDEVVAAARAVRQGVTVDALDDLWSARTDQTPLEVPVTVMGELVRRGVAVPEAAALMGHVVRTDVSLHLAAQIPGEFDGAVGSAATPVDALTQALRALDIPVPPGRRPGG